MDSRRVLSRCRIGVPGLPTCNPVDSIGAITREIKNYQAIVDSENFLEEIQQIKMLKEKPVVNQILTNDSVNIVRCGTWHVYGESK